MSSSDNVRIPAALQALAKQKRFVSYADLCAALDIPDDSCNEILTELVGEGVLRSVASGAGQPFYWITLLPKPDTDA